MPIVTVQVTREGNKPGHDRVTPNQKAEVIRGISQVLLDVLGKPLDRTHVLFQQIELEDWGQGGLPLQEYRKQRADQTR
jgi:4-oxalocrotonate tautomerase